MPLIGTKMPNYTFLAPFKPQIWSSWPTKLKLIIHLTKSPKGDHIFKLSLHTLEEHKCFYILMCAKAEI